MPQRLTTFVSKERHADIAELGELLASAKLTVAIDRSYPLGQASTALADLVAGRVRGKSAIRVTPQA